MASRGKTNDSKPVPKKEKPMKEKMDFRVKPNKNTEKFGTFNISINFNDLSEELTSRVTDFIKEMQKAIDMKRKKKRKTKDVQLEQFQNNLILLLK